MSVPGSLTFETILKKMYGEGLEYLAPYEDSTETYPLGIFNYDHIPSLLIDKIHSLKLKMISEKEKSTTSDHDIIVSTGGRKNLIILLIFTQTLALKIFENAVRQEYKEYLQKENSYPSYPTDTGLAYRYNIYHDNGPITSKELISKIPALKELITGSRYGIPYENGPLEFLGKSRSDLEEAEKIIRAIFNQKNFTRSYNNFIRVGNRIGLDVLEFYSIALEDLKTLLNNL